MNRKILPLLILLTALFLGACAASQAKESAPSGFTRVSLDELPDGLGRGFPQALVGKSKRTAQEGKEAPDFAFVLEDGRGVALSDLRGKPVVLNFWASWCGPCRAEMPEFVALAQSRSDVVVLEVNVQESLDAIQPFVEEFNMTMPVIVDEDGNMDDLYPLRGLPTTIFVDPEGRVNTIYTGIMNGELLNMILDEIK